MQWFSIHIYPLESQDVFLTRAVKPFLEQYIWSQKEARAFFIRYQDEKGPHIRLRMRGEADWIESLLKPAFDGWMQGRGEWEAYVYQPETDRFGGEEGMAWAEEYFHVSTRVVLERLAADQFTYGDAMFDALRLHIVTSVAAGFNREKAQWYFTQLLGQWLPLFFGVASEHDIQAIKLAFQETYSPQQAALSDVMDKFWGAVEAENFDPKQPEWLRWFKGNELILKGFGDKLELALPSLIHLTNNRLGINNQDEAYLNFILSDVLKTT